MELKISDLGFWIDVACCLPFENLSKNDNTGYYLHTVTAVFRSLKLWKIIRYFNFLDNVYPSSLFIIRLGQTTLVVLFAMHFLACLLFAIACPEGLNR